MARELCPKCKYPISNCLCDSLSPVQHRTEVIVLQHPSEVKNAKNTVRLLSLISANVKVYVGETERDFSELKAQLQPQHCALLFPGEDAIPLDSSETAEKAQITQLLVLDGTWKKAKKILFLNPWLEDLNKVSFADTEQSQYQIRSTNIPGGLSTIEAVAASLNRLEDCDTAPFICALNGLKHSFTKQMPDEIKARYKPRE